MTIERNEKDFHLRRAADEDLPDWYHARLERALLTMSKLEAEEREAQGGATGSLLNNPETKNPLWFGAWMSAASPALNWSLVRGVTPNPADVPVQPPGKRPL